MPRRLPEKTKNAPNKPRRFGSQSRFSPCKPFLRLRPVKEIQEIEVVVDDIESRGGSVTGIQDNLTFVPRRKMGERGRIRIRGVSEKSVLAERTI